MARRPTVFIDTEFKCVSANLPFAALPYLRAINAESRGAAIRKCVEDHAAMAAILLDTTRTDAEKVAALIAAMPHVQRRAAQLATRQQTEAPSHAAQTA